MTVVLGFANRAEAGLDAVDRAEVGLGGGKYAFGEARSGVPFAWKNLG